MSYNLLFDTQFNNNHNNWKYVNCRYENGNLISNNKVFGIEQEIILPDITKLYFRCKYNILGSGVLKAYIGIQNSKTLSITKQWTKPDKERIISVVEDIKQEKVKVHIIFESVSKNNVVQLKEPLLCDIKRMHKAFWLKFLLDKLVKYRFGYSYKNMLEYTEIKPEIFNLEKAKIGSIISTFNKNSYEISANLIKGRTYLIKLDYEEINNLGDIYFSYGMMRSDKFFNEQIYLLFRATDNKKLYLNIDGNDVLPYEVNLKNILLIDTETIGFEKSEIPYLPFI